MRTSIVRIIGAVSLLGLGSIPGMIRQANAREVPRGQQQLRPPNDTYADPARDLTVKRVRNSQAPLKRWYLTTFAEFTGPSADFALPLESYSTGSDYWAPMKLFQSITPSYALNENHRVGVEFSANKPLQGDVLDRNENYYSDHFTVFDPFVFLQINRLFTNSFSWVNTKLSADLPTSSNSKLNEKITSFYVGPVWNFQLPNPSFYFQLYIDLYYNLYRNPQGWTRFSAIPGHSLGYYFNPRWSIDTTTSFDFGLISQGNAGYQYSTVGVDRVKITLRYQPVPNVIQLGTFMVVPLYNPGIDRTALGLNLYLWL